MKLFGFNFKKIEIERLSETFENLKVNTNINIGSIEKIDSKVIKGKEEILQINFTYTINYDPKIAKIEFIGNVILSVDPKISKEILKEWNDKKISQKLRVPLFNIILRKSNIKALQLEDEMNLPLHIPLPSVKQDSEEKKKE